ncbi:MAG: SIR2 family protein [Candidatus Delongbacteria bacterium]|jgi:hypothetical protein|nr:SIR2 family protein [Candidatus Delongbacteria bacterium]
MEKQNKRKLVFLFGAGISKSAGLPLGNELTEKLLNTDKYYIYGKDYKWDENPPMGTNYSTKEHDAIKFIYDYLKNNGEPNPNYERIYYLAELAALYSIKMDSENKDLQKEFPLRPELYPFFKTLPVSDKPIYEFYSSVCNYIQQFICKELNIAFDMEKASSDLSVIIDSCKDNFFDEIIIFTLNHDILLESLFGYNKIAYNDGFSFNCEDKFYHWDYSQFKDTSKVKLIKLHGSIYWYKNSKNKLINEINGHDSTSLEFAWPMSYYPIFLTGTDNKYFNYTHSHFLEMLNYLYETLYNTEVLFISGYGFCDHGINNLIFNAQINSDLSVFNVAKSIPNTVILIEDEEYNKTRKYIEDFKIVELKELYLRNRNQ